MGVDHGKRKAFALASEDVISTMPENVITNIMNCLPIRDAVRTSILARNWRFKWTLLTQLEFDLEFIQYDAKVISRLLLDIKGPVTKFSLDMRHEKLHVEDVNHWVFFLSRKGIKDFTLLDSIGEPFKMPTHLFSCLELKHLMLYNCSIYLPLNFHSFPNLLSLDLYKVTFENDNCGEFISRCPLLESLIMDDFDHVCKVNPVVIENLGNLKKLDLPLRMLENMVMAASGIFRLLGLLPKLEELVFDLQMCKFVAEVVASKQLPVAFHCLKALDLCHVDFGDVNMLSYAAEMILASPNLQTLTIRARGQNEVPPPAHGFQKLDCSRTRQLQLRRVSVFRFMGSEDEICLIKYLLASSPYLERLIIHPWEFLLPSREFLLSKLMLTRKLLKLPRASPFAEVDFHDSLKF